MPARLPLFIACLLLAGLLFAAGAAHGAATEPSAGALALEEPFEGEAEEGEEGEGEEEAGGDCEAAEEEVEEGELGQDEADEICAEGEGRKKTAGRSSIAPEECILRSAHAHAALTSSDQLKLTIGYTTYEAVGAKIQIGHIATLHRHLGRSGVLRLVKQLPEKQVSKRLAIRIRIPGSPGYCGSHQKQTVAVH